MRSFYVNAVEVRFFKLGYPWGLAPPFYIYKLGVWTPPQNIQGDVLCADVSLSFPFWPRMVGQLDIVALWPVQYRFHQIARRYIEMMYIRQIKVHSRLYTKSYGPVLLLGSFRRWGRAVGWWEASVQTLQELLDQTEAGAPGWTTGNLRT